MTLVHDEILALYVLLSRKSYTWDELEIIMSFKQKLHQAIQEHEARDK